MTLFIAAIVALAILAVLAYNGLVALRVRVREAWSQIDVQLKRRRDLIPNLVEAVKDVMSFEQEVLQNVTRARASAMEAKGMKEVGAAEGQLTQALKTLFAVAENYPQIKSNQNVLELQEELTSTENRIAFARQHYNDSVMRYNTRIQMVPFNVLAGLFGFSPEEFFVIPEAEREAPRVDLR